MNERDLGMRILSAVSGVREDMLALVDALWETIDRHDAESRETGNKQIAMVERHLGNLQALTTELGEMLKSRVRVSDEELPGNKPGVKTSGTDLLFTSRHAYGLHDDLTSSKPVGYILQGAAVKDVTDWSEVYLAICKELFRRDPDHFLSLADNPRFVTRRGNLLFSRSAGTFLYPKRVTDDVYAELKLSVKSIFSRIRMLFDECGIPYRALEFYIA